MPEAPMIPEGPAQAVRDAVQRGIAEVFLSGGVERIEFASTAFVAWLEEVRAAERRKVAEEIAAALDERASAAGRDARNMADYGAPYQAEIARERAGALATGAEIARQTGEADA